MAALSRTSLLALALAGCLVPTIQPEPAAEVTTSETSSGTTGVHASMTSVDGTSESSGPPIETDSSSAESSASETGETTGGGASNGYFPCSTNDECESGNCFAMGALGGVCSECDADADCIEITGFGCTPPDIASPDMAPALCGDGSLGSGCETSDACVDGLTCELVLSIPLVHEFTHCSSCATHDDCTGDEVCSVTIDLATISGYWSCLPPNSVEIGGTCDHDGDGDLACASGNCAEADIDNLAFMGLCSECDEDSDCTDGSHCQPADIDTFNVMGIPAVCVPD